ncbi:unnamed protein product [Thelazia callipaeda]|uniref:AcidPPc domain-containing protein n=1 Tax=Thelazia callipaeda TaxID=103827 RepID=A0A158RCB1_THECL|nr:unnamed protein product [Thelazia callipaeda]
MPYKRGFYCDDESIRYPYRPSTVSRHMLIVVGLIIPVFLIVTTEMFRTLVWERKCQHEFKDYRCRRYRVPRLIVRLYIFVGYFLVGVVFNQLMVDIAKYTIGRHRPHFMDICKPKGFDTCPVNSHKYITDFECTGTDKFLVQESMLSFYSGHSAFSFYAAWYTVLYLQARLYRPLFSRLVLPVIQFVLFGGATFVAYTRVSNYKHHWSDVLVGTIFGSVIGIVTAVFVAEVFSRREIPSCHLHYDEFGLSSTARRILPMLDMESGVGGAVRNGEGNDRVQFLSSSDGTVSGVMASNINNIGDEKRVPTYLLSSENQRL